MEVLFTKIEYLKGVGPKRAEVLAKELGVKTFGDLLAHFPFRHEDRSKVYAVNEVSAELPYVQVAGTIANVSLQGSGTGKQRLVAYLRDETGRLELVWFKGVKWASQTVRPGLKFVVFGKPNVFNGKVNLVHPELEPELEAQQRTHGLEPVYHTTEAMKRRGLDSRGVARLMRELFKKMEGLQLDESLPPALTERYAFPSRDAAIRAAHFPSDAKALAKAIERLKFEELFYTQIRLLKAKRQRVEAFPGQVFDKAPTLTTFYNEHLPFELTGAQKRVVKEIYRDFRSGRQMNRLLQGDVGSGKTIVAFICMLIALDSGAQACLMAPTEILAEQHYNGLKAFADMLGLNIGKLTGSTKKAERKPIHEQLLNGQMQIVVGTHALIEDTVDFQNLGLCVIDEQHRFGVAQRAKLWKKTSEAYPHILVMTATPIPRTLAMTLYGDLDVSVIDELPKGRKPIVTEHRYESSRLRVFGFIKQQVALGRQAYIVYPLVEESEKLDYKNVMEGYEAVSRAFPDFHVSVVHGRMKAEDKEFEMQRFLKAETQIMVATTVIEVGVNVPNASVMVIENAEKFGLAQLHQLRGRVGRGAEQSYCVLMTGVKLSKEAKIRLETMTRTNNGFEIADVDLKLRGPGDISGTQQSGALDLQFADLGKDQAVLQEARACAQDLLAEDPKLESPDHAVIVRTLEKRQGRQTNWSRIS